MTPSELRGLIRTVPDFPAPGILFRDVTTLLADGPGFAACVGHLAERARAAGAGGGGAGVVAGIGPGGFVFGAAIAAQLGIGFVPVRKPGKLPGVTLGRDYALEYGRDRLEIEPVAGARGPRGGRGA